MQVGKNGEWKGFPGDGPHPASLFEPQPKGWPISVNPTIKSLLMIKIVGGVD